MDTKKQDYFKRKLGNKLDKFIEQVDQGEFVLFFLAKKQAGKGTYSKLLQDLSKNKIVHISIGDLVREAERRAKDPEDRKELVADLKDFYKGGEDLEKVADTFANQSVESKLLPTEMIMALIENAVKDNQGRPVIIDGFPRALDQVALSLQMREDFEKKGLPAAFVEIDCPDEVLEQRYIHRRSCPACQTPRNIKLLLTEDIEYDKEKDEFHLICDHPTCSGKQVKMVQKQGDDQGIEAIAEKQKIVTEIMKEIKEKSGDSHITVYNSVPIVQVTEEDMEDFTDEAELRWDPEQEHVVRTFKPMKVKNDQGEEAYSRWPEAVVVEMVDKLTGWLDKQK